MNDEIFKWYISTLNKIKVWKENMDERIDGAQKIHDELTCAISTMEMVCPYLKERNIELDRIQNTFTPEQIDHICYQIGEWYVDWKVRITDKGIPHKLGIAKEKLKTMICGY
jgi:hypothetical protein